MEEFNDCIGQKLEVGDEVAYMPKQGPVQKRTITKMYTIPNQYGYETPENALNLNGSNRAVMPYNVVNINKKVKL